MASDYHLTLANQQYRLVFAALSTNKSFAVLFQSDPLCLHPSLCLYPSEMQRRCILKRQLTSGITAIESSRKIPDPGNTKYQFPIRSFHK